MPLFNRQYKLVIGKPSSGQASGFEITDLHINFLIAKTLSRSPNKNEIKIWNLKDETRAELEKPDILCYLYAGYEENAEPALIFQGNVLFAYTKYDLPDKITHFELGDGAKEYRDTTVSLGYNAGVNSRKIIEDIASKMGLPLSLGNGLPFADYPSGFSFYGAGRSALTKACSASNLTYSIQNGVIQVVQRGGSNTRQAIVLAADSGLIGSPERERQSAGEVAKVQDQDRNRNTRIVSAQQQYEGWRTTSLLMPTVLPGDQVKLESRSVQSVLIAAEVYHKGDNMEGDWQTELKLVDSRTAKAIKDEEAKRAAAEAKTAATRRTRAAAATPAPVGTTPTTTP